MTPNYKSIRTRTVFWSVISSFSISLVTIIMIMQYLNILCQASKTTMASFHTNQLQSFINKTNGTNSFEKSNDIQKMLTPPVVIPAIGKQTATIIFFHGLNDTGESWTHELSRRRQPYMKVICPNANRMPISINLGEQLTSWWDRTSLNYYAKEDIRGILNASRYVHNLIDEEIKNGTRPDRIIVAGFAQGGALALHAGLTYHTKLGAIVAMSAWLPRYQNIWVNVTANKKVPILHIHGKHDIEVFYQFGQLSWSLLKDVSDDVGFELYYNVGHTVTEQGWIDVKEFMKDRIGPI